MSIEVMSSSSQGMFGMHGISGGQGVSGSHGLSSGNSLSGSGDLDSSTGLQELPDDVKKLLQQLMAAIAAHFNGNQSADSSENNGASALSSVGSAGSGGDGSYFSSPSLQSKEAVTPSDSSDDTSTDALADLTSDDDTDDALDASDAQSDGAGDRAQNATQGTTQGTALTKNAGGVSQAAAISGVDPKSSQVMNTGTGSDKTFNYTNDTDRTESITYSVEGQNKATMTLKPGETGTFVAGSADLGVRISPSDAQGNTHPDEVLYEDGGADNGQAGGAGNPDVSKVDGDKDFNGVASNMTVTLSDGRTAGDGDAIRAYQNPTDDAAAMGLAGDASKTVNIVQSDVSAATA